MSDSITRMLRAVKSGDQSAMAPLWERYSRDLKTIAGRLVSHGRLRVADEDDVLVNTFERLWNAAQHNQLESVQDRESLSRLLTTITTQKAIDLLRSEHRQRRGGGAVRGDSVFPIDDAGKSIGFDAVSDTALAPELEVMAEEQTKKLLRALKDDELASIAMAKMDGYTNREIGELLECSQSTVERSLRLIRKKWRRELADEEHG
ncbi:sigma-70 family RNA polymerase sigma factor [Pirellulales bacterium]|nr:sigma-70 family RNA polymerase sigma factor [Pirellulales bacterium]